MNKLILILALLPACASVTLTPMERKQKSVADMPENNRTLEMSDAGLTYPYRICSKKFLGICTKWERVSDDYLPGTPEWQAKKDAGFVCRQEKAQ